MVREATFFEYISDVICRRYDDIDGNGNADLEEVNATKEVSWVRSTA